MVDLYNRHGKLYPMSEYGKKIKWAIKNAKRTQKDVAKKCGISESVLSKLIKRDIDDIDNLLAVCRELKISISGILSDSSGVDTEQEFIQLFRKLNPDQQARLIEFLKSL